MNLPLAFLLWVQDPAPAPAKPNPAATADQEPDNEG